MWNGTHILLFIFIDSAVSLKCWHCIYDNCDMSPQENKKAEERFCLEGQFCQKVYFHMYSTIDKTEYASTVRGCAWDCQDKDDFKDNCTREISTSIGCVVKSCCKNVDLCNSVSSVFGYYNFVPRRLAVLLFLQIVLYLLKYFSYSKH